MIGVRRLTGLVVVVAVLGAVCVLGCASVASAASGASWWGVSTGARPSNLAGGSGKDEVQQVRVKATKGDFVIFGEQLAVLPFDVSPAVLQEHLEAANPSANVVVSEEASHEEHARLLKIVYPAGTVAPPTVVADTKELAELIELITGQPGGEALEDEGAPGEAEASELQKGARSENEVVVYAENLGNASTSGKVTITDRLPAGLTATSIRAHAGGTNALRERGPVSCVASTLTCTFEKNFEGGPGVLPPFELIEVRIGVRVTGSVSGANVASVSGGGVAGASTTSEMLSSGGPLRFGIESDSLVPEEAGGGIDTQAGSHPFQLTDAFVFTSQGPDREGNPRATALAKDITGELPPGLVGNTTAFARCTDAQFEQQVEGLGEGLGQEEILNACPASAAVGAVNITFNSPSLHLISLSAPVFNMVPRPGEPVRLGFKVAGIVSSFLDTSVRTGDDYGVSVSSLNVPQGQWLLGVRLSFWGVPGDPAHDQQRGWDCLLHLGGEGACPASNPTEPPPFLAMPTSCALPFESQLKADSWAGPGKPAEVAEPFDYTLPLAIDGCNRLPFSPSIKVILDGSAGSSPSGLNVDVHVPQDAVLKAESLAESAVKDITVTLPEGVSVNPAGGDGLQACSESLVGFTGFASLHGSQTATFTPTLPEPLQPGVDFCPDASKIGTVKIKVPIIANPLEGSVYLATQNANPFGSLIGIYIIAQDPVSGVLVKLPGEVRLSDTGQITTTFHNSPQAPFEDAELHFFGGERAPLSTPARCGAYTTTASFTPWSGNPPVSSSSTFNVTSGPNGTPCPGASLPFSPSLTGGTTNIQAGAFSQLTTTMSRQDGNQDMQSVVLHMPPGLTGLLSGVKLCPEQNANEGTCSTESLIGETTVSAGVGSDPVSVKGGKVYITEHYAGSPFGLS
ncbi:MAG TPA: hypothetical protein VGO29_09920, partial [Solirubrobacteraceae bacterium]|nr:hypothetical protein [Solirubrobacteraceae bacterium]